MDPKFHCGGENITVLQNQIHEDTETVLHICRCRKCGETFGIEQSLIQWKKD